MNLARLHTPFVCISKFVPYSGVYGDLDVFLIQWQVGSSKPDIHPNAPAPPIQCLTL